VVVFGGQAAPPTLANDEVHQPGGALVKPLIVARRAEPVNWARGAACVTWGLADAVHARIHRL